MKVPFNKPPILPDSEKYISQAITLKTSGDGIFTKKCSAWIEDHFNATKALLTTSCTHALDMAAYLCGIKEGDEVIMASYTFPSTANAFVGQRAKIIFVDIRPDTMNIDEALIEPAVTNNTRAIVPMHYAGVSCEMDAINSIAQKYNLFIVEDAAQGVMAEYNGKSLGTIGDYGCYSFHETKNYSMGEGGALIIKDKENILNAEITREKGTDRSQFFRNQIDKYSWVNYGSSYLPSEINAAYLWSQFEIANEMNNARLHIWNLYYEMLKPLANNGILELPCIPETCCHNANMFYIKVKNSEMQEDLLAFMKNAGIGAVFHYVPLHNTKAGRKFGVFHGDDKYTTFESSRLIRLPLYYGLSESDINEVVQNLKKYWHI